VGKTHCQFKLSRRKSFSYKDSDDTLLSRSDSSYTLTCIQVWWFHIQDDKWRRHFNSSGQCIIYHRTNLLPYPLHVFFWGTTPLTFFSLHCCAHRDDGDSLGNDDVLVHPMFINRENQSTNQTTHKQKSAPPPKSKQTKTPTKHW